MYMYTKSMPPFKIESLIQFKVISYNYTKNILNTTPTT